MRPVALGSSARASSSNSPRSPHDAGLLAPPTLQMRKLSQRDSKYLLKDARGEAWLEPRHPQYQA